MRPATHEPTTDVELLRLSTAGSVDDGKSTLIGRLLYETKGIFDDQLDAVERASHQRGAEYVNLALLTDGLRAEREQGITIDVAYRHFATPRRRFILADTPGHVQYTRNMVTGTSTADLTVVLLDARKGPTEQSRRHLFVASLLRVPRVVICPNKMDLVDYARDAFEALRVELRPLLERLGLAEPAFIPISALHGDNVVARSDRMPWYDGPTLLEYLEQVPIVSADPDGGLRLPVQWVIRPYSADHHDYRGYAGQIAAGIVRPGDPVRVLPSGLTTRIRSVETAEGPVDEARAPLSVTVTLEDDLDVSRGDLLCHTVDAPEVGQDIDALVCWLSASPLRAGARYHLKHTTRLVRAVVKDLTHRLDVNTHEPDPAPAALAMNEIGRVTLRTTSPLVFDPYGRNHATGSFILIDEATNETAGAGLILMP